MRNFLAVFLAIGLAACTSRSEPDFRYLESKTLETSTNGSRVMVKYPVFGGAADGLNQRLAELALTHLEQVEDDPLPFLEYAKNFTKEAAGKKWVKEAVMTLAYQSPSFVTTICKTYTDIGDGDPLRFVHYNVIDTKSGRPLYAGDLIEEGKMEALRALAKVTKEYPNEPQIGLLAGHLVYRADQDTALAADSEIPYSSLQGILRRGYLP